MSDDNKGMSSSELAHQVVKVMQDQAERSAIANRRSIHGDTTRKTPMIVWGAFFGLVIAAFHVDPAEPITLIAVPATGMALGAGIGWSIGAFFRLVFVKIPRLLFGKSEPREPPV